MCTTFLERPLHFLTDVKEQGELSFVGGTQTRSQRKAAVHQKSSTFKMFYSWKQFYVSHLQVFLVGLFLTCYSVRVVMDRKVWT